MAWKWRKRGRRSDPYRAQRRNLLDVSVDLQIDEAVLIATAGARLGLKNLLILRTLRDGKAFDAAWYASAMRQELLNLANEAESDAERVVVERRRALRRAGQAQYQDDYRLADSELLERREHVMRGLAERLRTLSGEEDFLARMLDEARERALDEVAGAIHVPHRPGDPGSAPDSMEHLEGLALLREDLEALERAAARGKPRPHR